MIPETEHAPPSAGRQRRAILGLVIFAILLLPLLVWLGFWQLERAAEKTAILTELAERRALPALEASQIKAPPLTNEEPDWRHRQVRLLGRYHPTLQWLLDNRIHEGRPGYEVLTAFELDAGQGWILVNRGWLPAPLERSQLPELPVPPGQVQLLGHLDQVATPGLRLSEPPRESGWPRRVQVLELAALQADAALPLLPWQVRLEAEQPGSLVPRPVQVPAGPAMHQGYAVQWFGLALVLVLGTVIAITRMLKESR